MSRVYDDIQRAAASRLRIARREPEDDPRDEAGELADILDWQPASATSQAPRAAGRALAQVDHEMGQRLDALQFSLNALEDRFEDEGPWSQRDNGGQPAASVDEAVPAATEWMERLAQLEVSVHALEDQLDDADDPLPSRPQATGRVPAEPHAAQERSTIDPLMIRIEALRGSLDRANQRQNILFGILVTAILWIYAR